MRVVFFLKKTCKPPIARHIGGFLFYFFCRFFLFSFGKCLRAGGTILNARLMQLKTYKGKHLYQPHFFIINKGNNCGRPSMAACANCFVVILRDEQERHFYFSLCSALWEAGRFEPLMCGTVVSFIRVDDLRALFSQAVQAVQAHRSKFSEAVNLMNQLNEQCAQLQNHLQLLQHTKRALFRDIF